ncbi:Tetratricopeptide-like helical [Penicillium robsamsonii]|uniref:Tetratricopeptide-like helical n=1 Tax=Penicillium robsamsonii TaxID=1792511 RepID=UPI0025465841|nr:Tetratricopeptide-like helical [Penicillium robsamsonii]KAJ5816243.1 Tetratricopeptide-like helical [Penicillium robsamsonii]
MDMRGKLSECRSISHDTLRSGRSGRSGTSSPRVAHFDGEVPPALSPLDAFAAQSRFLARQLDESRQGDRRMSRLPPSSVARSLSQGRPGFGRSKSSTETRTELTRQPTQKGLPEYAEPKYRPVSEHPRFSSVSNARTEASYYEDDDNATPRTTMLNTGSEAYGMPRAESPEAVVSHASEADDALVGTALAEPQGSSIDSSSSRLDIPRTLAPPVSPRSRPSSSAKVAHPESSDDDYSSSNGGSTFSKPRKLSSGSAVSLPYSPMSTFPARPHPRSPSMSSETSGTGGNHLPRPSFNFSRPLSRSSTSLSAPGASTPTDPILGSSSNNMSRRSKPTPLVLQLSTEDVAAIEGMDGDPSSAVSSYVYAKYALPRGRFLSRDSVVFAGLQTPHFEWNEPLFEKTPPRNSEEPPRMTRTPSPTPHRQLEQSPKPHSMHEVPAFQPQSPPQSPPQPQLQPQTPKSQRAPPPPVPDSPVEPVRPSAESTQQTINEKDETVSSADSASTMRPQTATAQVTASGLTADDHVAKGIECHERGSLSESTYHLRVAAKQDHPTGMLLYALACRHGWGMRSNEKEGVRWLRKAVDSVGLEMLANPDAPGASKAKELQKAYRVQFALSIYELGVSYLNGWGIEQDKSLALRCFEIAGQWGDVDAMAEAGFCYAEGVGCKKDMKKAARFYRQAESKGMSMVGNSWIYKDKYNETDAPSRSRGRNASGEKDKKPRSKSRTRSIFQRKKSIVPEA